MKILHIISQRPDSTGSGIYVQAMIQEASAAGHDNFLIAGANKENTEHPAWINPNRCNFVAFKGGNVTFIIPGMSDTMPYESSRFCDLTEENLVEYENAFSKVVQDVVQQFNPDVIHSHHLWIVSSLVRQLFPDIPMVTSCHGTDLRQFLNCSQLRERVLKGCRRIDKILALSRDQKNEIARLYQLPAEKIRVVGAGYNKQIFYRKDKPAPTPVQIIYVGKLSRAKGLPWLLRALQSLDSPAWQLQLIGGGSGEEKTYSLGLAKRLGKRVHVHGAVPQKRVAELMRESHILVLPSFFEGLALVILEGLASGCRVVSTDLPGVHEIMGNNHINFISLIKTPRLHHIDQPYPEDEKRFEQNLRDALQHQINAVSQNSQIDLSHVQNILDSFTWSGVFKKVLKTYS